MRTFVLFLAVLALFTSAGAQQASAPDWQGFEWLAGSWSGQGGGTPGQASGGGFSFTFDLQRQVLVRKSFAEYPATKERPAFRHDDLTIVYADPQTRAKRAVYFDNEGHVIHYIVSADAARKTVVFLSEAVPGNPSFRLTYLSTGPDNMKLSFDIAPPGKTEFKPYVEATAHRVK